jgi:hypothetical protein
MEPSFDHVQLAVIANWVSRLRDQLAGRATR